MAGNRGEWAELYVLLKLLGEGKLYAADQDMNKNLNSYLEVLKILREEVSGVRKIYDRTPLTKVDISIKGEYIKSIPVDEFLNNAKILLDTINTAKGRAFDVSDETKAFMDKAEISSSKAKSISSDGKLGGKNDIFMEIRDPATCICNNAGFSIKAKGKHPATLFNTAQASAFVFKLTNMDDDKMNAINGLVNSTGNKDKVARMEYIVNNNIGMEFIDNKHVKGMDHSVFADNLYILRSDMQAILMHVILYHYLPSTDGKKKSTALKDICNQIAKEDPLKVGHIASSYYKKAIKDFLYATFAGMTASIPWNGEVMVNGGYIVAKENGDVLVFHTRDNESFRTFLFNNTRIDRPDASEKKGYPYAHVYKEGDDYFFDLNMQIRFCN